jgi:hypothetical protein
MGQRSRLLSGFLLQTDGFASCTPNEYYYEPMWT